MIIVLLIGLVLFFRAVVFLAQSISGPTRPELADLSLPVQSGDPGARLVICPVRNDLSVAALESVAADSAGWGRVVVADDSDANAPVKEALREQRWRNDVKVMRRKERGGWKAGNLNAALKAEGEGVREFVVLDADTVVRAGFLAALSGRMAVESRWGEAPAEPIIPGAKREWSQSEHEILEEVRARQEPLPTGFQRAAFIQARLEWNAAQPGALARWMGPSVGLHFRTSMRARAEGGFTMFHGHAALIDMEAWREADGFPEIVSEDLGFSLRLRGRGWRGVYADDIVAYEDFPPTAAAWRRRQDKWIRGTADCLRREAGPFLRSKQMPLREKADMLLNAAWLYMAPVGLVWFVLLALQQPALMHGLRHPTALMQAPAWDLVPTLGDWFHGLRFTLRWGWPVGGVMAFLMLVPLVPALVAWWEDRRGNKEGRKAGTAGGLESRRSGGTINQSTQPEPVRAEASALIPPEPKRSEDSRRQRGTPTGSSWTGAAVLRFWFAGSYLWLSSLVVETLSLLVWLVTGKARFDNTLSGSRGPGWKVYHPNHPAVHLIEVAAGGWFLWQAWALVNPWLAAPGLALATAPLAVQIGWEWRVVRILAMFPLLIALGMFALMLREMLR